MTTPVRAAILGSGLFATKVYLPSLKEVGDLQIRAVWSRSAESGQKLAARASELSLPSFDVLSGEDGLAAVLARDDIDAVILVLPITAQPAVIRRAWEAGKHVLSEKPLGRDVKEAKELIAEYEEKWKPKGIVWRVAENWAHEPLVHKAGELLRSSDMGPVLYWRMHSETVIHDGQAWHGTPWRTIPDYQGGFILDGGVHWAALLRTVLSGVERPASVTATKSLHRAHVLPHDTLVGIVHPLPNATVAPRGAPTAAKSEIAAQDMPVQPGKSTPHGTFVLSWAAPDTPVSGRPPNELYVVAEHGTLRVVNDRGKWTISLTPSEGSGLKVVTEDGDARGVEVELDDFAHAVAAALAGKEDDRPNHASPRDALWDLAFIEAALNSDGKPVEIDYK